MSYDYDKFVTDIEECRRTISELETKKTTASSASAGGTAVEEEAEDEDEATTTALQLIDALSQSVELFDRLSGYCPMTPLLWMQYAQDAATLIQRVTAEDDKEKEGATAAATANVMTRMEEDDISNSNTYKCSSRRWRTKYCTEEGLHTRLQLLELGLHEFPGSALLRYHYVEMMLLSVVLILPLWWQYNDDDSRAKIRSKIAQYKTAIDEALTAIGHGSHRNEATVIVELYRRRVEAELRFVPYDNIDVPRITQLVRARATTPMNAELNATLNDEGREIMQQIVPQQRYKAPTLSLLSSMIESHRRYEAKYYGCLQTYEDDIELALQQECGIVLREALERITTTKYDTKVVAAEEDVTTTLERLVEAQDGLYLKWDSILRQQHDTTTPNTPRYGMGLGGPHTAQVFTKYAQACARYRSAAAASSAEEQEEENKAQHQIRQLTVAVYERGIAECPTMEGLWISYVRQLLYLIEHAQHTIDTAVAAATAVSSAIPGNQGNNAKVQLPRQKQELYQLVMDAANVVDRSLRNCPYSLKLIELKFRVLLEQANTGTISLDPEAVYHTLIQQQIFDAGFVFAASTTTSSTTAPSPPVIVAVHIFQFLFDTIRKRILFLLADVANRNRIHTTNMQTKRKKNKKSNTVVRLKYDDPESIQELLNAGNTNNNNKSDKDKKKKNKKNISEIRNDENNYNKIISIDDELLEEIEDLCTDLRELYDEAESYVRQGKAKHPDEQTSKPGRVDIEEGRYLLGTDRTMTESYLLSPLLAAIRQHHKKTQQHDAPVLLQEQQLIEHKQHRNEWINLLNQYDAVTKIYQPPSPSSYASYIQFFLVSSSSLLSFKTTANASNLIDVITNLRRVRLLYQKAIKCVGDKTSSNNKNEPKSLNRHQVTGAQSPLFEEVDYETSLRCLCNDYIQFEKYFGSYRSYMECIKTTNKKLSKIVPSQSSTAIVTSTSQSFAAVSVAAVSTEVDSVKSIQNNNKRKLSNDHSQTEIGTGDGGKTKAELDESLPPTKKQKIMAEKHNKENSAATATTTTVQSIPNLVSAKEKRPKIKIGKLEYPAHPYTVKVSCLDPETDDMDLVQAFRPKCGPIVHAKITREKKKKLPKGKTAVVAANGPGKSKGWGLVQFEERESVETALQLSNVLGIRMKCVKIERSHMPAVSLVPPTYTPPPPRTTNASSHDTSNGSQHRGRGGSYPREEPKSDNQDRPIKAVGGKDRSAERSRNAGVQSTKTELPSKSKKLQGSSSTLAFLPRGVRGISSSNPRPKNDKGSTRKASSEQQKRKIKIGFSSSDNK